MSEPQAKAPTEMKTPTAAAAADINAAAASSSLSSPATAAADRLILTSNNATTLPELAIKKSSSDDNSSDDNASAASNMTDGAIAVAGDQNDFDEMNAAPMHLHALSGIPNARLRGISIPRPNSEGKLSVVGDGGTKSTSGRRSRSTSRSRPGSGSLRSLGAATASSTGSSRSSSPLPTTTSTSARHHLDATDASTAAGTAVSSLDGIFDPDVLLDRLGFIDLDPPLPHEIRCGPLAAPGTIDGKSNNSGGLTPVNERLSEETLDDCHAFNDLVMNIDNLKHNVHNKHNHDGMSSTMSMPSVAHSSLSGMRSDMSVGSLSVGSFKGGHSSRGGSVAGGSLLGDGENSVLLGAIDEESLQDEAEAEAEQGEAVEAE